MLSEMKGSWKRTYANIDLTHAALASNYYVIMVDATVYEIGNPPVINMKNITNNKEIVNESSEDDDSDTKSPRSFEEDGLSEKKQLW